jgi:hypothetical protein
MKVWRFGKAKQCEAEGRQLQIHHEEMRSPASPFFRSSAFHGGVAEGISSLKNYKNCEAKGVEALATLPHMARLR